jgi:RNA polymerase primary sigma factor
VADEEEEVEVEGGDDEEAETQTGPDPVEVARRMELLKSHFGKFEKTHAKYGSADKKTVKAREEMAGEFMKLKLPLALIDALVRKVREVVSEIKDHERKVLDISTRLAKMPRKDFIKAWPTNETNLEWADEIIRRKQKWSSGMREHRDPSSPSRTR